jgi:pyrroline-5-carboxylate reductase
MDLFRRKAFVLCCTQKDFVSSDWYDIASAPEDTCIISMIAAGISIQTLKEYLGPFLFISLLGSISHATTFARSQKEQSNNSGKQ